MNDPLRPLEPGTTPIILHLGHTGGTTLLGIIGRQYAEKDIYRIYQYKFHPTTRYMEMSEAERRKYKLIVGHLFYGIHRHVPGPSKYVTMLRHPIDRLISSYTYGAHGRVKNREKYASGTMPWKQHIEERTDSIRQLMRILGGDDTVIQMHRNTDLDADSVDLAIRNLDLDFAAVGLQDRYDESLLMMRYVLNWKRPITYVRMNTSKKRIKFADLSAEDRKLIEEVAEIEMPLYEYAQKRFEAQVAAYPGDLERELAQFRADNVKYAAAHARIERVKAPFLALKRALQKGIAPKKK